MERITSTKNPRVKEWASLKHKKYREQKGLFFIEGTRLVEDALRSNAPVETLLLSEGKRETGKIEEIIHTANALGIELIEVNDAVISHVTDTQSPQGVVAIVRHYEHKLEESIQGQRDALYLALEQIQDPGNLGTMIRTADAVGATGVLIGSGSVDLYNPKVVRATMGSLFHLPVFEVELMNVLPALKERGIQLIGTSVQADQTVYDIDLTGNVVFVIGSEAHGLSEEVRKLLDTEVNIPMPGSAESLNAAIASAVILYEAVRQRMRSLA
ncbi:RNA methyltransferase [Collibacillus ludicampi]|uniref:RNA methyltransferase n=1 Tax=Collibacillus ludicampi TaxID=2771369 RepID=A0AAV4LHQ0_9BACL|nr:RNA methyltransferase [Collibacillus ludicampi]GIM47173.1 RNA methyltransferase [Collibacillus ludicampi]